MKSLWVHGAQRGLRGIEPRQRHFVAPHSHAVLGASQGAILTESEKPVCWFACSICFCKDKVPPGWRNPIEGEKGLSRQSERYREGRWSKCLCTACCHLSGWAENGHGRHRAAAAAVTGTALQETLKGLSKEEGTKSISSIPLENRSHSPEENAKASISPTHLGAAG